MAKFLELTETEEQIIVRRTVNIISRAVRECNKSLVDLKNLSDQNGGKDEFLTKLGSRSAGVFSSYLALKTLVESISDLSADGL